MIKKTKAYLLYFLFLVYLSGAIGMLFKPAFFLPFTPYTLILTAIVFLSFQPTHKINYLVAFAVIILFGLSAEIIGVKTGLIFGDYSYGQTLGYKVFSVPLVISLNWAVLLSCGIVAGCQVSSNRYSSALISALIVTTIDFLMEQVVTSLDFWYFKNGMAGIHNYAGWLILSFFISFGLQSYLSHGNRRIAYAILSLQIIFFGILNLYKFISS